MKTFTSILIVVLITFLKSYPQNFWEKTSGPDNSTTLSIAIGTDDVIIAGTDDAGVYKSTDNGETWFNVFPTDKRVESILIKDDGEILIGTQDQYADGGMYRSTDNGASWTVFGIPEHPVMCIVVNSNGHIFAGTASVGIYRSTDNGINWLQINQGLTNNNGWHPTSLAINSSGHIFAGTIFGGVFKSTDNGENWMQINQGLTFNYVISLAINSSGDIFAGTVGYGIFRSTNNGDLWIHKSEGLAGESSYIYDIALNSEENLFAATLEGIFKSTDNGESWNIMGEGLVNACRAICINSEDDIFIGTETGIYRHLAIPTIVEDTNTQSIITFELLQNYPNPFNPKTVIGYQLPVTGNVILKIYDVLGNQIATLVDEVKEAGNYEVEFDAAKLSSGVYYYTLKSDNFIQSKKMLLLK